MKITLSISFTQSFFMKNNTLYDLDRMIMIRQYEKTPICNMRFLKFDFLENFILQLVDGTPLCDTPDKLSLLSLSLF